MPSVDTGAPPKWPPALAGLADTFDHHSCCLRVSPATGVIHTHQSIHHSCSWAFQAATLGSNPAYKHILRKYCQAASGMHMLPTKGTVLEHLTLVTEGDNIMGTSHATQSHSQDQEVELVYPICRKKPKVRQNEETKEYVPNKIRRQTETE